MEETISVNKKSRGRPATGKGVLIGVRLQPLHLKAVDAWIAEQSTPVTRPEAIRAMIEAVVHIRSKDPGEKSSRKARIR